MKRIPAVLLVMMGVGLLFAGAARAQDASPEPVVSAESLLADGNAAAAAGDLARAITLYSQALELAPDNAEIYWRRGIAYAGQQATDSALADYNRALELNPQLDGVQISLGNLYYELADYTQASVHYSQAAALNPDSEQAYWGQGNTYYALERRDEALANYRLYLTLAGDTANAEVLALVQTLEDDGASTSLESSTGSGLGRKMIFGALYILWPAFMIWLIWRRVISRRRQHPA